MEKSKNSLAGTSPVQPEARDDDGHVINASGHAQELDRNFNFMSICSVGVCTGNVWAALGGTIVVALYNGGPPGVIYELMAVSIFYWIIASLIAELASAVPSSAGVYHWATVTAGPRFGKVAGWYAGWWNVLAWIFADASISFIVANIIIAMWGLFQPSYVPQRWHVFIAYLLTTWSCCAIVMFANRTLPVITQLGLYLVLTGVFITILICVIMPSTTGSGHSSNATVWKDWQNLTGYESDGFVFLLGMLNGAYAVGTPDCLSHLAEEIPLPRVNLPKAIAAQMVIGFVTALCYLVAILYSISNLDDVFANPYAFPLAEVYRQATSSRGGALGLLMLVLLSMVCTCIGCYITSGRMLWTLARDDMTPFSRYLDRISPAGKNPLNATLACGIITTILGCIYVGSLTAFNAFVGSFVILSTLSYLAALLPYAVNRRAYVVPGPFWLPPAVAYPFLFVSCSYMIVFAVIYCFPFSMPVTAANMNYASLITGGLTVVVSIWYLYKRSAGYTGARVLTVEDIPLVHGERLREML